MRCLWALVLLLAAAAAVAAGSEERGGSDAELRELVQSLYSREDVQSALRAAHEPASGLPARSRSRRAARFLGKAALESGAVCPIGSLNDLTQRDISCDAPGDLGSVDPRIGTGGDGYGVGGVPVGSSGPAALVRPGPDTTMALTRVPWRQTGGYSFCDTHIRSFSHTHLVGAGVMDLGNIGVMPSFSSDEALTECPSIPLPGVSMPVCRFALPFSHRRECSRPGYYRVDLLDSTGTPAIRAEITSLTYTAVHRYTWLRSGDPAWLYVDLAQTLGTKPGSLVHDIDAVMESVHGDSSAVRISGTLTNQGDYTGRISGGVPYSFVITVNGSIGESGVWRDGSGRASGAAEFRCGPSAACRNGGFYVRLDSRAVEVVVALSQTSVESAVRNEAHDRRAAGSAQAGSVFDSFLVAAQGAWGSALGAVRVRGGSMADRLRFTTALYHALLGPTRWSDADGSFRGPTGAIQQTGGGDAPVVTELSIWDTFRTQFPLTLLLAPQSASAVVRSLEVFARDTGVLPRWTLGSGDAGGMEGYHAAAMLADAVLWRRAAREGASASVPDVNATLVAAAASRAATAAEGSLWTQPGAGYVPNRVCETLECAQDDACRAVLHDAAGEAREAASARATAGNWRNVWNGAEGFFCARNSSGAFVHECADRAEFALAQLNVFDKNYVEGDAWHWRWYVPHEPEALAEAFGGAAAFRAALTEFFSRGARDPTDVVPDPYYWPGNEEDLHAAFLFAFVNDTASARRWAAHARSAAFPAAPGGLPGNDDYGALSSWLVWSSLGLYPHKCKGQFVVTEPAFDDIRVTTSCGTLRLVQEGTGQLTRIMRNGQDLRLDRTLVAAEDLCGDVTISWVYA